MDSSRALTGYSPAVLSILHRSRNGRGDRPDLSSSSSMRMDVDDLRSSRIPIYPTARVESSVDGSRLGNDNNNDESKSGFIGETREFRARMMESINIKMELERQIQEQNEIIRMLGEEREALRYNYEHEKSVYEQERQLISKNMAMTNEELEEVKDRTKEMEDVKEQYEINLKKLDERYKEAKQNKLNLEKKLQEQTLNLSIADKQYEMVDNNRKRCEDSLQVTQNILLGLKEDIQSFKDETEKKLKDTRKTKTQNKNELTEMNDKQLEMAREYQYKIMSYENELKNLMSEKENLDNEIIKMEEKISSLDISHQQNEIRQANKEMNKKLNRKNLINKNIELVNELNIVKYELESLENALANQEAAVDSARRSLLINKKVNEESFNLRIKEQDKKRKANDELIDELTKKYKELQAERQFIEKRQREEGINPPQDPTTSNNNNNNNENNENDIDIDKKKKPHVITPQYLNSKIEKATEDLNELKTKMDEDKTAYTSAKEELLKRISTSEAKLRETELMLEANLNDKSDVKFLEDEIDKITNVNNSLKNDISGLENETKKMLADHATSKDVVERNNNTILSNESRKIQVLKEKINNLKVVEAEEVQRQDGLMKQLSDLQKHLDAEVEEKNKNLELKKEIETITNQIEQDRETEIRDREKELRTNTRKLGDLKEQKEALKNRKRETEDRSAEMDKEIAMMKLSIEDLKINKENWSKDIATMKTHYESTKKLKELRAEQNLKSLAQLKTQKQLEITILKNDIATLDGNLREIKNQCNNISIEVRSKEQQRDILQEKNKTKETKYNEMKEKIMSNLEKNKEKLNGMKERFDRLMNEHKEELNSIRTKVDEMQKQNNDEMNKYTTDIVKKNDEARTEMKKKIITLNHELDEINNQITSNRDNFFSDITNLKIETCNNEQLIKKGENEKSRLERELSKATETFNNISNSNNKRIESMKNEVDDMEKKLEELNETREALIHEVEEKNKELEDLRNLTDSHKNAIDEMNKDLEQSKLEYIKVTEENDNVVMNLRTKISMARTKKMEVEKEKEALLREESKIDALINQTKSAIEENNNSRMMFQSKLSAITDNNNNNNSNTQSQYPVTLSSINENDAIQYPYNNALINGSFSPDIYDRELVPANKEAIPELQKSIQDTENEIEATRENFKNCCIEAENRISEMEYQIENNLDEKQLKTAHLKEKEDEVRLLEDKIQDEEDEINDIEKDIEQTEDNIKFKNQKVNEYEARIELVKSKIDNVDKLDEVIVKLQKLINESNDELVKSIEEETEGIRDLEDKLNDSETTIGNIIEADKGKSVSITDEFVKTGEIINEHINTILNKMDQIDKLQFECDSSMMKIESIITKTTSFGKGSMSSTTQDVMRTFSNNLISLFRSVFAHIDERKKLLNELSKCITKCQHSLTNVVSYCAATRDDIIRVATRRLNLLSSERDEASDCCDATSRSSGLLSTYIEITTTQNECLKSLLKCVEDLTQEQCVKDAAESKRELEKLCSDVERLKRILSQKRTAPVLRVGAE